MRWYSPRDWIEEEEEEDDDCSPSNVTTTATATSSSPAQQMQPEQPTSDSNTHTERETDEGSTQETSNVSGGGDTEMEVGEAATVGGDGGDDGESGDGWDNEGWREEDWDMINDDEEVKSRQEDSPSQDNSMPDSPAIKVRCAIILLLKNSSS